MNLVSWYFFFHMGDGEVSVNERSMKGDTELDRFDNHLPDATPSPHPSGARDIPVTEN